MIELRVNEVREAKGLSISRLSRLSDLSYKTVKALLDDPTLPIGVDTLAKLADALEVDPRELYSYTPGKR